MPLPLAPCPVIWTNIIIGTPGPDQIAGTSANDLILGLGGNDEIYGANGRDLIYGGDGNDDLTGGRGDDCLVGGAGVNFSGLFEYTMPNGNDENHSVAFRYLY